MSTPASEKRTIGSVLERLSDVTTSAAPGLTVEGATTAHHRGISWPISGDATTMEGAK